MANKRFEIISGRVRLTPDRKVCSGFPPELSGGIPGQTETLNETRADWEALRGFFAFGSSLATPFPSRRLRAGESLEHNAQ